MDEQQLLTVKQVAWILQLNEKYVYRQAKAGKIPSVTLTGIRAVRFRWSDIDRWMRTRNVTKRGSNNASNAANSK
jgi:excisionase family DNA binding protein